MSTGIYKITNLINNKSYIGKSINIEQRFKQHIKSGSKHSYIDRSIKKHGANNFTFEILLTCEEKDLDKEEQKFIKLYGTYKQGYNLTWGGDCVPSKMPEIAKKISNAQQGKKNSFYGKKHSNESRKLMSEKRQDMYGIKNPFFNKKHTLLHNITESKRKNTSGYFRVTKHKDNTCNQGFIYVYRYYDENKKRKSLRSVDIKKLEKKVKEKGLEWIKF